MLAERRDWCRYSLFPSSRIRQNADVLHSRISNGTVEFGSASASLYPNTLILTKRHLVVSQSLLSPNSTPLFHPSESRRNFCDKNSIFRVSSLNQHPAFSIHRYKWSRRRGQTTCLCCASSLIHHPFFILHPPSFHLLPILHASSTTKHPFILHPASLLHRPPSTHTEIRSVWPCCGLCGGMNPGRRHDYDRLYLAPQLSNHRSSAGLFLPRHPVRPI